MISKEQIYLGLIYTHTAGVTPGTYYYFKVKAVNKWGEGEESLSSFGIIAATVPDRVITATTEVEIITGGIKI